MCYICMVSKIESRGYRSHRTWNKKGGHGNKHGNKTYIMLIYSTFELKTQLLALYDKTKRIDVIKRPQRRVVYIVKNCYFRVAYSDIDITASGSIVARVLPLRHFFF